MFEFDFEEILRFLLADLLLFNISADIVVNTSMNMQIPNIEAAKNPSEKLELLFCLLIILFILGFFGIIVRERNKIVFTPNSS